MSVLLLTATINSGYFGNISTKITDTAERKNQYADTLEKYICESNFDKIVFAENSCERLDEEYFMQKANQYNKKLEFLSLPGNKSLMKLKGKSYGEAKLISEAIANSKLIKEEQAFYKVTGRVWISNINKLINDRVENNFVAHNFKSWVRTSFFKIRKDDFYNCLIDAAELCDDNTENYEWCIEHVYYECLKKAMYPVETFLVYPDLRGINSGSGAPYTKSSKALWIRNVITKNKGYKMDCRNHGYYIVLKKIEELRIFLRK